MGSVSAAVAGLGARDWRRVDTPCFENSHAAGRAAGLGVSPTGQEVAIAGRGVFVS